MFRKSKLRKGGRLSPGAAVASTGKLAQLRKKIIREVMVCGAVVAALLAGSYALGEWAAGRDEARTALNSAVTQLSGEVEKLRNQLTNAERALPTFEKLFKNPENTEIALDRQRAAEIIEKLKEEYLFASLRISMAPVKDLEDPRFKNGYAVGTYVEMQLTIEALSDEHILNFLNQLKQELPGRIKVASFTMAKITAPNSQMLALISQSGKVGLVKAELRLLWMGLKPKPPGAPAGAAAPAPSSRGGM